MTSTVAGFTAMAAFFVLLFSTGVAAGVALAVCVVATLVTVHYIDGE